MAFIALNTVEKTPTESVCREVMKVKGIQSVFELAGAWDVIAVARAQGVSELNSAIEKIRKCSGVVNSTTFLVLQEHGTL
jgi:DNA-binding Lrp family transcriptional regulator